MVAKIEEDVFDEVASAGRKNKFDYKDWFSYGTFILEAGEDYAADYKPENMRQNLYQAGPRHGYKVEIRTLENYTHGDKVIENGFMVKAVKLNADGITVKE